MPVSQNFRIRDRIIPLQPEMVVGQWQIMDGQPEDIGANVGAEFELCTGGANASLTSPSVSTVADYAYTVNAAKTLLAARTCPMSLRPYLTHIDAAILGPAPWAGGTAVLIQDTNLAPLVYIPLIALKGLAGLTFPTSDTPIPLYLSVMSVATDGTGKITFASAGTATVNGATITTGNLVASSVALNNTPFTVVAGTGQGQSGIISAYAGGAGSTLTPVTPLPVVPDTTSVIAVWYWEATSGSTTSATFSNAGFTGNALDNGFNLVCIASSASQVPGAVRAVSANTGTAVSTSTGTPFQNAVTQYSVFAITNNSEFNGALDLGVIDHWSACGSYVQSNLGTATAPGVGIQVNTIGTFTAGSPIRFMLEGRWAK